MKTRIALILAVAVAFVTLTGQEARADKIGALATVLGADPLRVEGVGIVVGLNGTGDKSEQAKKNIQEYLSKNNISLDLTDLSPNTVALVHIDAEIPAFARVGQRITVRVAAMDSPSSLENGVLLNASLAVTPNGEVLAWAAGRISVSKNAPASGLIPDGAQLMTTMAVDVIGDDNKFRLSLKSLNWMDASRIAARINDEDSLNPANSEQRGFGEREKTAKIAWAKDPGQVEVQIPDSKLDQKVEFVAQVLDLEVAVDRPARVLINKQLGTVVVTGDVRVARDVVVSHNGLTVTTSAPAGAPNEGGRKEYTLTDATPRSVVEMSGYGQSANLREFIDTLNAMGARSEDVSVIVEKLIRAGALNAELIME